MRGEWFVVMPLGKKLLPDGRTYDFDKVHRVIITRAVQEVGLKPFRADETVGSRLIHPDKFKDLRDRAIVISSRVMRALIRDRTASRSEDDNGYCCGASSRALDYPGLRGANAGADYRC